MSVNRRFLSTSIAGALALGAVVVAGGAMASSPEAVPAALPVPAAISAPTINTTYVAPKPTATPTAKPAPTATATAKPAPKPTASTDSRASRSETRKPISGGTPSSNRELGRQIAASQYGWTGSQFTCLNKLWTKESGWDQKADNPSSSAYGIAQALPGSKMASFGSDWRTNPATQIKWGLNYIDDVYGSPCAAWNHSVAKNWY